MAAFHPKLVQAMRDALDEAMTRVPTEYATVETKAYLAEYIPKAAAQGRTTYRELVAAASHATARRDAEITRGPRFSSAHRGRADAST
jgi:hypothetical protein